MYHDDIRFILASASPRRVELLSRAGYAFDVMSADVDEVKIEDESPHEYVTRLAIEKASMVALRHADRIVLAADTVVLVGTDIFGKPQDSNDAARMLRLLSGRTHNVLTGVAVRFGGRCISGTEMTAVSLVELNETLIKWYVDTGETSDKAGSYGVQGLASRFVSRVEGSYSNVVGLPLVLAERLLRACAQR